MRLVAASAAIACCATLAAAQAPGNREWRVTGGDAGSSRHSSLTQIDRANVRRLQVAWTYHAGGASERSQIQATPIVVGGVLYGTSPDLRAFALRAATGEELWRFDPTTGKPPGHVNRGVVFWGDGAAARIFFTAGARLYALNAATGRPIEDFGDHGSIDLTARLGRDAPGQEVIATSPGVIYRDLLIQGTRVSEGDGAAPGDVRAFDVRTGAIRWTFHTIPHPGEFGYDSWPDGAWKAVGAANSWAGMSVDVERGIVYVPTGSPAPDFYGGARIGSGLFGNTLLALDAATGRRLWHFQTVHHDIWDRDLPAAPNLLTVMRDNRRVDAVAQIAKSGFVFVFDRVTGKSLFEIEERPVALSTIPGERVWPTQPYPVKPAPFARQLLTESDLTDLTPAAHDSVLARFRTLRPGGLFTPPSLEGSIVFPGFDGGGEWGGAAADPDAGVLYVNASDVPWIATLVPTVAPAATSGANASGSTVRSPYQLRGYERWKDPNGYPAVKPPWGTLSAIDLNSGDYLWKIRLGEFPELTARGVQITGTEQYGGPIVTAGGLLFIAGTPDEKFRAFDKRTGELLWEAALPAAGYATPATYEVNGRQFVVIAAGGGKLGTKSGDAYVAFALPSASQR